MAHPESRQIRALALQDFLFRKQGELLQPLLSRHLQEAVTLFFNNLFGDIGDIFAVIAVLRHLRLFAQCLQIARLQ